MRIVLHDVEIDEAVAAGERLCSICGLDKACADAGTEVHQQREQRPGDDSRDGMAYQRRWKKGQIA